jgi:uncharacterized membrane protein YphA (DoxX/SURF4 family)
METKEFINTNWKLYQKVVFRFFSCFFILYVFPFPIDNVPFGKEINKISEKILAWYDSVLDYVTVFWHWLIPIVGKEVIHLKTPITTFSNGSGDTTYDFVLLFTMLLFSLIICIAWSILDRKRKSYNTAYYWLCVLVRYALATELLSYGFGKVFHLQMHYPNLSRLVQPYGDSSPMGLVWTYMGQSKAFSAIVGWSEVVCGLLLFFRKTTLLGALFTLIVLGNVMAVNYCYDVPVKLFSSVLELMALFLTAPYLKRIYQIFVQHKTIQITNYYRPVFTKKWMTIVINILKLLIIADALFYGIKVSLYQVNKYGDKAPKPSLYGIYNTELIIKNNDTISPVITDTTLWRQIIIQSKNFANIKLMNDSVSSYNFRVDTIAKKVVVFPFWDTLNKINFYYIKDSGYLTLVGKIKNDSVRLKFKRFDENKFRLISRGFHWVNEFPYMR